MPVHWVIDRAVSHNEGGYAELLRQLELQGSAYTLVRKPPFADYLIGEGSHDPITLELESPVFVQGTTSMALVSAKHGWEPGYVRAPGLEELGANWEGEMLNFSSATCCPLRTATPLAGEFFVRPMEDTKAFPGTIMSAEEFLLWQAKVVALEDPYVTLRPDDLIVMAPVRQILAEYRLYVVDGRVVTGSRYKLGSRVHYTADVDPAVLEYAAARLAEYVPARAVCLDVAHVPGPEPYKIIETNSISGCGFYACDMGKFVAAINQTYG